MPDKTYRYCGPLSAVSLPADAEHPGGRDVQLAPGRHVTLPEDNDYVRTLVARKYLVPVAEPEAAAPAPAAEVKPATTSPSAAASPATATGTAAPAAETVSSTTGATHGS